MKDTVKSIRDDTKQEKGCVTEVTGKLVRFRILIFAFLTLFSSVSLADKINVYTEILYPWQYMKKGKLTGFSVEVVEHLCAVVEDTCEINVLPWARAYSIALNEKNAMLFSVARNEIRENQFQWVGALAEEKLYFWGLKSRFPEPVASFEQLKKYQITVVLDTNPFQYLTQEKFPRIYTVSDAHARLLMMYRGRTDLILDTVVGLQKGAKDLNLDMKQMVPVYELAPLNTDLSIAFNKQSDTSLVSRYQEALKQMNSTGSLLTLKKKWGINNH